jgi:hypothetical protein
MIIPNTGVELMRGEVFISSLDSTLPQSVPIGLVQDFEMDDTIDLKEAKGPRSRMPIAVAQGGAKISGTCTFMSINAQIQQLLRGAVVTKTTSTVTTGTVTSTRTITKALRSGSNNIKPVALELFDVDNEGGPHVVFYNLIFTDLKSPRKLDDYTMFNASYVAYPEVTTGAVYATFYPGDQTVAYTLPTGYTADTGIATSGTDYAALVIAGAGPVE